MNQNRELAGPQSSGNFNFGSNMNQPLDTGNGYANSADLFNRTEFSTIGTAMQMQGGNQIDTQWGRYTAARSPRQMSANLRIEL
jgi:hypothetical protein